MHHPNQDLIVEMYTTYFWPASYIPALCLVGMCWVDCNSALAVVMLCIANSVNSVNYAGHYCSHQDIAPNLAGTLMGYTSTFSSFMGAAAPAITGVIINENVRT